MKDGPPASDELDGPQELVCMKAGREDHHIGLVDRAVGRADAVGRHRLDPFDD